MIIDLGDFDLVTANHGSDDVSVLLNDGGGRFELDAAYMTESEPYSIVASDLDGDGDDDLIVANRVSNSISTFFCRGNGTLI